MREKVAILGGGVAGVVLAHELSRRGREVHLFESRPSLGGLQKSVRVDGLNYDIGTFVLSDRHEMFTSFPWLKDFCLPRVFDPQAVRASGRLDKYPISFKGYAADFGYFRTLLDIASIIPARARYFRKKSLPDYIRYYLGNRLYVNSGLKHYVERLYQLEDSQIDIAFATQRLQYLRSFSFKGLASWGARDLANALRPRASRPAPASHTDFVRPQEGFGALYARIEEHLRSQGVEVLKEHEIARIVRSGNEFRIDERRFDRVISTIPVPAVARYAGISIEADFECVDLTSLFYRFQGKAGFDSAVLFNYTRDARWKRLTRFSRYYGPADNGDEYFTVESISGNRTSGDVEWLREDFEKHVRSLGLFQGELKLQGFEVTRNAYPVFRISEAAKLARAKAAVEAMGIHLVGRQGAFEFLSSSQTAARSRQLAEELTK